MANGSMIKKDRSSSMQNYLEQKKYQGERKGGGSLLLNFSVILTFCIGHLDYI